MNKFYYSRSYIFEAPRGRRKHYFFHLVERFGEGASFRLNDKDNSDVIPATIVPDGDTETATFLYRGHEYSLRADRYHSKGYPLNIAGMLDKKDDKLKDAHLHTANNAGEFATAKECGCICCQRLFPAEEVEEFAEHGETAVCPYCGCDALIADSSGINLTQELITDLNKKYF